MTRPLVFLLAFALTPAAWAQPRPIERQLPPPALMVKVKKERSEPLALTRVETDVRILGHLAETSLTMTFYNPHDRVLEGDLYFPLPEGSTVSGYGLDIQGQLVDGVVVRKEKARQVFEKEVRKGVDPGLVEWTKGNNFKTRVFPIPAKGSRTIRVEYVAEVAETGHDGASFHLPLAFEKKIKSFSLRVEVVKAAARPVIVSGGPEGLSFGKWRDSYVAETRLENAVLDKDLHVRLPELRKRPVLLEEAPDGNVYFAIRDVVTAPPAAGPPKAPERIALFWDASASRARADHQRELTVLERYLEQLGGASVTVDLYVFRNALAPVRSFTLPGGQDDLLSALKSVDYDGGTQLGSVNLPEKGEKPDLALIFSDGVSNFGPEDPTRLDVPSYLVNSSSTANHAFLRYLAMRTGGAYFNLNKVTPDVAAGAIGQTAFSYLGASSTGTAPSDIYPQLAEPVHQVFALAGKLTRGRDETTVTLSYGRWGEAKQKKSFTLKRSEAVKGDMLRRYWAQKKVAELAVFPDRNAEEMVRVGREHSIVTPGTSLIVLETFEQYLEHRIRPPAGLAKMRAKWDEAVERQTAERKREETSKLERVLALWKQRVAWWEKEYKYPKNFRYGGSEKKKEASADMLYREARTLSRAEPAAMRLSDAEDGGDAPEEAPAAKKPKPADKGGPEPGVVLKPWDPDTPYVRALKAADKAKRWSTYLAQKKKHGGSPAFYLDCADFFLKVAKDSALALQVLSNLAELELENPALLRVLAHRLGQLGHLDLSVMVFEEVRKLRPEEPQSFRDLALVLARRADESKAKASAQADYRRAMELLAKVVMEKWDRFNEIEVIALMELNNIFAKAQRVGLKEAPVDPRLIKALDVDVRIVMTWDADSTDMDLHVIEPSSEEAYYSHNRTTIGGMVTRDFTQGYGPEVYLVRKAMRGRYVVRTKFFGSSAAKLQGAVTLQVDVFTNYGRKNEKRRSMTLRLTEKKETFTVGEIEF